MLTREYFMQSAPTLSRLIHKTCQILMMLRTLSYLHMNVLLLKDCELKSLKDFTWQIDANDKTDVVLNSNVDCSTSCVEREQFPSAVSKVKTIWRRICCGADALNISEAAKKTSSYVALEECEQCASQRISIKTSLKAFCTWAFSALQAAPET